ncbi:N-acetylglucosamine kinase [Vibrio cincinnatiensis]|uniref:N-acetylglucosamine kinase n=1 Tax=Vibrio cincinnatiensis TaxID=675 RepID=UPI001EDFFB6E|nr:N-acetylglucosamine kinase [Vibrio cincinnatiensis]MCG3729996.1 N-acetylglucosamine kinase [Vibrio cincinnatiensis]
MMIYYVGIDGGGTSCRARIRDQNGTLIGEGKSGSANILLGVESSMQSIIAAINQAAQQGGLNKQHFSHMHLGLALAGAEHQTSWIKFMQQPHPFASITLNTDAYGACLGAHNGEEGAIMIAGTGSCGLFIHQGQQHVVGGREFPISDQGSGAAMGLHLIQQLVLIYDGIRPATALSDAIFAHFSDDIDRVVSWSKNALPRDYGQFCPQVFLFAEQGDSLAIELLKKTARDMEMFIFALRAKGATQFCLMGSIAERIVDWLSPPVQQWIVPAQFDAIEGALMFAGKPEHNLYKG